MQRIRIRYTKEDRVRFVSARDLTSVWERALRRADLPIAYSEGFTPHAKVSFPDALPVGVASTGEYAELTFAAPIDAGRDLARLSTTLPAGMDILTYWEVPDGAPKLARMLEAVLWELEYPAADDAADIVELLTSRSADLLERESLEVTKRRPSGDKRLDVRPALIDLRAYLINAPVLRAVLRNDGPTVRPTDLHNALALLGGASDDVDAADPALVLDGQRIAGLPAPRLQRRVAQGQPIDGGLREALTEEVVSLEPDRLAGAA